MIMQLMNRRPLACTRGGHPVEGYEARRQVQLDIAYRQLVAAMGEVAHVDQRGLPLAGARLRRIRQELYELKPEARPRTRPTAGRALASSRRRANVVRLELLNDGRIVKVLTTGR